MKKMINPLEYAGQICSALPKGILLTTALENKVNTMTIGWGMIGVEWGKPVFIALVRESRYTRELLRGNKEFTVNVPVGSVDKEILAFCGTKSGRDVDKISAMNLTLETPVEINVPGIQELPLTLECRVIYEQDQNLGGMPAPVLDRYYPQNVESSFSGSNRDHHIAFYGEIVSAYLIEE